MRFRDRWLYVLVLLEFQSSVDRTMAVRILAYTALLYQDLLRTSSDPLPPVLPIVLHHGCERCTAPEAVSGLALPPGEFLAPHQPAQRYFLLNVRDHTGSLLPAGRNLMAALIRLERSRSMKDVEAVSDTLDEWLSGPAHQGLKRALDEWTRQAIVPAIDDSEQVAEIGEWIIECESGEELLSRVVRLSASASFTTGDTASCQ